MKAMMIYEKDTGRSIISLFGIEEPLEIGTKIVDIVDNNEVVGIDLITGDVKYANNEETENE